jgi:triosephosphate isomerase
MRKRIVAGNWKMNNDFNKTNTLLNELKELKSYQDVSVMVSPPYPFLKTSADLLKNSHIEIISQNVHQKNNGAYTGEVSVEMLKSIGIQRALIGHSERRAFFNETDEILFEKVDFSLNNNLNVIFCFGEELIDRKAGHYFNVVEKQLNNTVLKINKDYWKKIILAYEPVWAIGTGETASPEQAQEMHEFVRNCVYKRFGKTISENVSILYGGSVKPSNAKEIFNKKDVDGGLVGGASLSSKDFNLIIQANSSF